MSLTITPGKTMLSRGKRIRNRANPESLAYWSENGPNVAKMFKTLRFEWTLGTDGLTLSEVLKDWIVPGRKGQLYERGVNKLGFSVSGTKLIPKITEATASFAKKMQTGDGEANFECLWTEEAVATLKTLLALLTRRLGSPLKSEDGSRQTDLMPQKAFPHRNP